MVGQVSCVPFLSLTLVGMTRLVKLGWFKSLDKEKNWFLRSSLGSSSGGGFYAGRSQGTQGSSLTASGVTNLMGSSQGAQGWSSQSAGLRGSLLSSQTVFNPSQGAASFLVMVQKLHSAIWIRLPVTWMVLRVFHVY